MRLPGSILPVALLLAALLGSGCASPGPTEPRPADGPLRHYKLAQAAFEQGNTPLALQEIRRAERMAGSRSKILPVLYYYEGYVLWSSGRREEAAQALRRALAANPGYTDASMLLAVCLEELGRPQEAVEVLTRALANHSYAFPEKIWLNRALVEKRMGRTDLALADLRRAVEVQPRYYRGHLELARLLDQLGHTDEALAEYEIAAPGFPEDPEFLYEWGAALFRAGRAADAEPHLRRVLDLAPGSSWAEKAKQLLEVIG